MPMFWRNRGEFVVTWFIYDKILYEASCTASVCFSSVVSFLLVKTKSGKRKHKYNVNKNYKRNTLKFKLNTSINNSMYIFYNLAFN